MPRQPAQAPLESWAGGIPLGSLEQLQQAAEVDSSPNQSRTNADFVLLPLSSTNSLEPSLGPGTQHLPSGHSGRRSGENDSTRSRNSGNAPNAEQAQLPVAEALSGSIGNLSLQTASAGSLWNLENAGSAPELRIPLPESSAPSIEHAQQPGANPTSASNAAGDANAPDTGQNQPADHAPEADHPGRRPRPPLELNYWQKIAPLVDCLPHLRSIDPQYGRHNDVGTVTCIDYFQDPSPPIVRDSFDVEQLNNRRTLSGRIRKLKTISDAKIVTRIILVEDLCPDLIEALGSTFQIDPEFFAEHLNRSGYSRVDYDDAPPARWETYSMPKSHASMTWFRPVAQSPKVTEWLRNPSAFLDKAMIGKDGHEKTVISSITWYDPEFTPDGRPNEFQMEHQAVVSTNIFRRSWALSARPSTPGERLQKPSKWMRNRDTREDRQTVPETGSLASGASGLHDLQKRRGGLIPTAWEERASFFFYNEAAAPIVILLLDPLPTILDFQTPVLRKRQANRGQPRRHAEEIEAVEMALPLVPRTTTTLPPNKFHATEDDVANLKHSTNTLISTSEAIRIPISSAQLSLGHAFRLDPIMALLRVVQVDSKAFFQGLEWTLDEISQDSLDDYLMTRRLEDWRKLMSDFEIEVPAIGGSLQEFSNFIFRHDSNSELPKEVSDIISDVNANIARVKVRLDEAYTALRADMQFTESRRSIAEAKTVTKLTELAFIFIPLSFTCSLFSMSIIELQNGVPVWTFVITALGMALLSYTIRLIFASDFIADSSRSALEKFWARRNVRRGDAAPISTLVFLTAKEVWNNGGARLVLSSAFFLFLSAFIVVPVAFIWTSTRLDTGFNVAMTLLLVLSGLGTGGFIFMSGGGDLGETVTSWLTPHGGMRSSSSLDDV